MLIPRISSNILFFLVLNYFLKKIIFLKFWHLVFKWFSADPALWVWYTWFHCYQVLNLLVFVFKWTLKTMPTTWIHKWTNQKLYNLLIFTIFYIATKSFKFCTQLYMEISRDKDNYICWLSFASWPIYNSKIYQQSSRI
jgi:hypothetical protein